MAKQEKPRLNLLLWAPTRIPIELVMRWYAFWLTVFGWRWAYFWARVIAALAWPFLRRFRGYALRNLELCFPDWPEAEVSRVARESFKHNIYSFFDYLLVPRYFKAGRVSRYFTGTGPEHKFLTWYKADEPGFNKTLHLGNFDICCFNIGQDADHKPLMLIVKEIKPPLLDRMVNRARTCMGSEVVHADEGAKIYLRAIKDKRKCGTIVDQNGGDFAPVETFFGVPCTWQADWTRLVAKRGVRLCYHACVREGDKFQFKYLEPEFHDYGPDTDEGQIIRDYRDWVERLVRQYPEQYMWVHRRFKGRRKGWPDRYANLRRRLTADERAAMLNVPAPKSPRAES